MAYPSLPSTSKSKINRAAHELARGTKTGVKLTAKQMSQSLELVNSWRVAHTYPLNTFNVNLREKVKGVKGAVVAQRLKRMATILDKLVREPNMELTTMQDLGGVRGIFNSINDVYTIAAKYKASKNHELVTEQDYIKHPRGDDGYRSYHLVYKYDNNVSTAQQYKGLRIEVQLRTRLQHNWATAVETMGAILGQQLKSRQGEKAWLDFFASVSSAFAHIEGTALVPGYEKLSMQKTVQLVKKREQSLNAINKLSAFSTAMEHVVRDKNRRGRPKNGYYLLKLDRSLSSITIYPYNRDQAEKASSDYEKLEKQASENSEIDAVLVSVGPLDELRRAYPNYFLDVSEFVTQLRRIISSVD